MDNSEYSIKSLQENLTMMRKLYGWTMEQLGERIGVTKQTISNLEHGNPKMTKIQYIAIRTILEAEANEREQEEKENLLRMLRLVCDGNPNVSDKQRNEAIEAATVIASATASGVASASAIKMLSSSLASIGVLTAVPLVGPVAAGVLTSTWVSKMLKGKNAEHKKK